MRRGSCRKRAAWLAGVLVSIAACGTSLAAPADAVEHARIVTVAREIMQKARYCALVTIGRDGQPQARIVDPLAPEPDLSVWIATSPATRKVAEIRANPRVTLIYFDPAGPAYVTLHATAELVTGAALKAAHWKDDWAPFYKDAHRGDDFVLIRSKPMRLEVVSQGHGIVNEPVSWRPTTIELP
jgi:general stress protein 26